MTEKKKKVVSKKVEYPFFGWGMEIGKPHQPKIKPSPETASQPRRYQNRSKY